MKENTKSINSDEVAVYVPIDTTELPSHESQQDKKKVIYEALSVASPFVLSRIVMIGGNFINNILLSRISADSLAAAPLISSTQTLLTGTTTAMLFPVGNYIATALGSKNREQINDTFKQGMLLATLFSIPTLLIAEFSEPLLVATGQSPRLSHITQTYFRAFAGGLPFYLWFSSEQQVALGLSYSKSVLISCSLNTFLTSGLGFLLTSGEFGIPKLGVAGLGYGSALSAILSFGAMTAYLGFNPKFSPYSYFKGFFSWLKKMIGHEGKASRQIFWELSTKCGSMGIQLGSELVALETTALMSGWLGRNALVTQQIATQYCFLLIVPIFGLAQVDGVIVGKFIGENNYPWAKRCGYGGIVLGIGISSLVLLSFILFPKALASAFIDTDDPQNKEVVSLIKPVLITSGLGLLADAVRNISAGALRGFKDTKTSMWGGIIGLCLVGLPLSYVMGFLLDWNILGVSAGRSIGMLLGAVVSFDRWYYRIENAVINSSHLVTDSPKHINSCLSWLCGKFSGIFCCSKKESSPPITASPIAALPAAAPTVLKTEEKLSRSKYSPRLFKERTEIENAGEKTTLLQNPKKERCCHVM